MTFFQCRISAEASVLFDVVIPQETNDAAAAVAAQEAAVAKAAAMLQSIDELAIGQPCFKIATLPRGACYPTLTPEGKINPMALDIEDYETRTPEEHAQDQLDDAAESAMPAPPTFTVWGFRPEPGLNLEDQESCTWFAGEDECRGEAETFEIVEKCGTEIWRYEHTGAFTAGDLAEFMSAGSGDHVDYGVKIDTLRWVESKDKVVPDSEIASSGV